MKNVHFFNPLYMNTTMRRSVSALAVLVLSISMALVAFASSYTTSYAFSTSVKGQTRYFSGSNIAFYSSYARSYPSPHISNRTYTVSLYRDKLIDDYIGRVTLNRDASGTARWSSVGAGNYYVYLSKANDGITLRDNSVSIYNY